MAAGDIALAITIQAVDQVTGVVKDIANGLANLAGGGALGAVATAAVGAGIAVAGIGAESIKAAGDFQQSMTLLVTSAGESSNNIKMVSDGILQMSVDTATSTDQLSKGMYMVESSGQHGAAGLTVLKAAAQGAKAENADLGTVANALTSVLTDYHLKATDAAAAMNGLITTVADGKTHLQDLSASMGTVLPLAASLGIQFPVVAGAIATMTNSGMSAQQAAQNLANTMRSLAAPNAVAEKSMHAVGISAQELKDTLTTNGLEGAIKMVEEHVGNTFPAGSVQAVEAFKKIMGGATGYATALKLGGENMKAYEANIQNITDAMQKGGDAVMGWDAIQGNFNFQIDRAKAAVGEFMIVLGQGLLPVVTPVVAAIGSAIEVITGMISTFQNGSVTGGAFENVLTSLGISTDTFNNILGLLHTTLSYLGDIFGEVGAAIQSGFGVAMEYAGSIIGNFVNNDLPGIIAGLNGFLSTVRDVIGNVIDAIGQFIGQVQQVWSVVAPIFDNLAASAFGWGQNFIAGFGDGIMSMLNSIVGVVMQVINEIAAYLGFASPAKKGPGQNIHKWGLGMVDGFITGMSQGIPQLTDAAGNLMKVTVQGTATPNGALSAAQMAPQGISYNNATQPVTSGLASSLNGGKSAVSSAANALGSTLHDICHAHAQPTSQCATHHLTTGLASNLHNGAGHVGTAAQHVGSQLHHVATHAAGAGASATHHATTGHAAGLHAGAHHVAAGAHAVGSQHHAIAGHAQTAGANAAHHATTGLGGGLHAGAQHVAAGAHHVGGQLQHIAGHGRSAAGGAGDAIAGALPQKMLMGIPGVKAAADGIGHAVDGISNHTKGMVNSVSSAIRPLGPVFASIVTFLQGIPAALQSAWQFMLPGLIAVGHAVQGQLLPAFMGLFTALRPLGVIILQIVGAIALGIVAFFQWATSSETLKGVWNGLIALLLGLITGLTNFTNFLTSIVGPLISQFSNWFHSQAVPALQSFWGEISKIDVAKVFMDVMKSLGDGLLSIWHVIQAQLWPALVQLWTAIKPVVDAVLLLVGGILLLVGSIAQWLVTSGALQVMWTVLVVIIRVVISILSTLITVIASTLKPVIDQIVQTVQTQLAPAFQTLWTAIQPLIPAVEGIALLIGGLLVGAFLLLLGIVIAVVSGILQAIAGFLAGLIEAIGGIIKFIVGIQTIAVGILNFIVDLFSGNFGKIQTDINTVWSGIVLATSGFVDVFKGIIDAFIGLIVGLIGGFVTTIITFFTNLYDALVGHSIIPDMVNGIIQWFTTLVTTGQAIIASIVQFFANGWTNIQQLTAVAWAAIVLLFNQSIAIALQIVQQMWASIQQIFGSAWDTYIAGPLNSLWSNVAGWFNNLASSFYNWGSNLMHSLASGIYGAMGAVTSAAQNVAQTITSYLGIHSPTELGPLSDLDVWMPNMMDMFSQQLQAGTPRFATAVNMVATQLAVVAPPSARTAAPSLRSSSPGSQQMSVVVELDRKTLTKFIGDYINGELRVQGGIRSR